MHNKYSLSLIIPAYNEEQGINNAILANLDVLKDKVINFEIIIIDDGSKDNTKKIVEENFINTNNIKFHSKSNGGFGSAVKKGIELAEKDYIMFAPVDSPLTNEVLNTFLSYIGKADILVSYRKSRKGYSQRMKLNSFIYHFLISKLFRLSLRDYNWIHLYKRELFNKDIEITYDGIFMLAEVLIKAKRKGYSFL